MIKRKLKWAIVPVIAILSFAGLSSFVNDSEEHVSPNDCYACAENPNYNCEFSGYDDNGNHITITCYYRFRP
jgi:hypothetical protein